MGISGDGPGGGDGTQLKPYHFQPGKSGNPGGQSKGERTAKRLMSDLILERTDHCAKLVDLLERIAFGLEPGMEDGRSRCFAIRELLDRAVGKAPLDVNLALSSGELTPEQRAALEALKMSPFARRQRISELKSRVPAGPEPEPGTVDLLPAPPTEH